MQLDISSEDAENALEDVLIAFRVAADAMTGLETALNSDDEDARAALLDTVISLRQMFRRSVVSLQFQDRLSQRMALAARELRAIAAEHSVGDIPVPTEELHVPKTVHSLYTPDQLARIRAAAGGRDDVIEPAMEPADIGDDIELF